MADNLDDYARDYYEGSAPDLWIEDRIEAWIVPRLAGWCRGRTLEMGFGRGVMTHGLLDAGVDLDLVEGSLLLRTKAYEAQLAGHGPKNLWHATFEDFAPGPTFDTVLCCFVLEHMADPVGLLRRVSGWLVPGGRLIVIVPNADSWHRRLGQVMTGDPLDTPSARDLLVGHVRVFDFDTLNDAVTRAGFDLRENFGWLHKALPNSMLSECSPEVIDGLCQLGWEHDDDNAANIGVIARKV